jgi:hypothetical protein
MLDRLGLEPKLDRLGLEMELDRLGLELKLDRLGLELDRLELLDWLASGTGISRTTKTVQSANIDRGFLNSIIVDNLP